jgi:mRNA-degrading endonuclease RelE of RelBE toxin-antitoxin system
LTYEVRLSRAAARQFRKLPPATREAVRTKLGALARRPSGSRGAKDLKTITGKRDRFFRLRVGDLRLMLDVLDEERVILVLGIVDGKDLERWLRNR